MFDLQDEVTHAVKRYLSITGVSITSLANELEISRPALSNRLHGYRLWQPGDIENLHSLGIVKVITDLDYGF